MPFLMLTGDQPAYTLILQIKNENSDKFKKIIPILESFHTHVAFKQVSLRDMKDLGYLI